MSVKKKLTGFGAAQPGRWRKIARSDAEEDGKEEASTEKVISVCGAAEERVDRRGQRGPAGVGRLELDWAMKYRYDEIIEYKTVGKCGCRSIGKSKPKRSRRKAVGFVGVLRPVNINRRPVNCE